MRHFKQISDAERHVIQKMLYSNNAKHQIAYSLERHHSSIYREIDRNKTKGYQHSDAHNKAVKRRYVRKEKLATNGFLRLLVITLLQDKNSPEVIAHYLKKHFPEDPSMKVSHEMIYQWIYKQKDPSFCASLFTRRKKRQNRGNKYINRGVFVEKKNIRERPIEAEEKSDSGHLEGDLIVSAGQDAYVLTLADRKNMYLWGVPVPSKDSEAVCRAVVESLEHLPTGFVKTITFDNGSEFNSYTLIEKALCCSVYFADPYCAWQRGLNEHLNGRIRQYLPKKKSFASLTDDVFQDILGAINHRPRKSRNWCSPASLLEESIVALET